MEKSKRVTMIDVARAAQVSHQTVSRVINDNPRVAPETRERVLKVIAELNYHPSRVARSLAAHQTHTLAVITYDLSYYGPTQMVINIEKAARQAGYDLFFANILPDGDNDSAAIVNHIREWAVDGALLIAPVNNIPYAAMLNHLHDIPLILLDHTPNSKLPSVIIDQFSGGYQITRHLLELGHEKICVIQGPMHWNGAIARQQGFEQALREAGLTSVASVEGTWTAASGYLAAKKLLQAGTFTAIVCANDQMAMGAISNLNQKGLRVPQDVSIVGFDDLPEAQYFSPPLTTVRQDFSELGRQGLEYLIELIQDPEAAKGQIVIQTELVIRESTTSPMS